MILSEEQLNSTSVRIEILEAEGMDFAGKIHLVETAIKEDDMMELTFPDVDSNGFFTIVGLLYSKRQGRRPRKSV